VLATLAICLWPAVAISFFRTLPLRLATLWTILGAQLLLPVGAAIKFEMVPQFDKTSVPNLCALIGCLIVFRGRQRLLASIGLAELLIAMFLISPAVTSELNGDAIIVGDRVLPGVGLYDAISTVESSIISLLPFFLGRRYLRGSADNLAILQVLVVAGLIYSLPSLFEVRFSPQLHYWVYGYYPTDFIQQMREGGFRPMVFMGHGLLAAFFAMTVTVAAASLWRIRVHIFTLPPAGVTIYLAMVLLLCKTLGATLYGLVLAPLVRFANPRTQMRIAQTLAIVALLYPVLRSFDVFPTKLLVSGASSISVDRGESLKFRFDNEDTLLERASERLLFGWGRYGRSRVYAEWGQDVSVTDGHWVLTLGQFGAFGFFAEFGLLTIGILRAAAALRFARSESEKVCLAALAIIVSVNIIDLLPNSGLIPWTWLLAGALLGRVEALRATASQNVRGAVKHQIIVGPGKVASGWKAQN
jgi:hypothetical protein